MKLEQGGDVANWATLYGLRYTSNRLKNLKRYKKIFTFYYGNFITILPTVCVNLSVIWRKKRSFTEYQTEISLE